MRSEGVLFVLQAAVSILAAACCLLNQPTSAGVVEDKYSCPHGWTRYGNKKCLKYVNELQDYERAQATCRSKNQGTLVTIHSHDEQNFVYSYIHSIAASSTPIWLGAKQPTYDSTDETSLPPEKLIQQQQTPRKPSSLPSTQLVATILGDDSNQKLRLNLKFPFANSSATNDNLQSSSSSLRRQQIDFESILWLDKTENTYTNWAASEPSHPDEICIAINPRTGLWHDVMCTEANVPACERAPTTQWPFFVPFCSEGWFQFNDEKCVRIISSQALNFYESQELCRSKYNSKLLSIKTDKESEFVHNLIKFRDVKLPVWLGAVQNDFSSFNWIDKSDVTFTNWAEGEPNDPDHACLSMTASGGKWSDNDCKEQKLILCQKVPEDSSCETGWLQFRQDKCYRFVHIRLAFDDAESLCNNLYGGHLPSIHSQEEQFMITQFLASVNVKNGSEIWLGGRQMDFHNFHWGDGSHFNYSYWEHGEPNFPAEKCIEMSWRNGRWNDINCRLKRAVLCEHQVTSRHLLKPNLYQPTTCLESNCSSSGSGGGGGGGGGSGIVHSTSMLPFTVSEFATSGQASGSMDPQSQANSPSQEHQLHSNQVNGIISGNSTNHFGSEVNFNTSNNNNNNQSKLATPGQQTATSGSIDSNGETQPEIQSAAVAAPPPPPSSVVMEDKPIKVITSIMHREHSLVSLDLPAPLAALNNNNNNSTVDSISGQATNETGNFIHYNLPPPEQVNSQQQLPSAGPNSANPEIHQQSQELPAQQVSSANASDLARDSANQASGTLLNKLRHPIIEADVGAQQSGSNQDQSLLNMAANTTASLQVAAAAVADHHQQQQQLVGGEAPTSGLVEATKSQEGSLGKE